MEREYKFDLNANYVVIGLRRAGKTTLLYKRAFDDYIHFGGFPETLCLLDKRGYVSGIYQKVLFGDMASRNGIRNVNGLRPLVKKTG